MNIIKSRENEKIKLLKKLSQKKYRDRLGLFCVENYKIIIDAYAFGYVPIMLFIKEEMEINNDLKQKVDQVFLIDSKINEAFSELDTPPGICAVYEEKKHEINMNKSILYLNGVSDPGNMGTIMRTALAFGVENVVGDEKCADIYNSKTIQAAKDSVFKLNFVKDKNLSLLKTIKKNMKIFSTRMRDAKDVKSIGRPETFCLVLGSEAHGVNSEVENLSDEFIKIDIDKKMESLNVAVAGGIILHALSK